MDIKKPAFL